MTFGNADLARAVPVVAVGPNDFAQQAQVVKVRELRKARKAATTAPPKAVAIYRLAAPGGSFDPSDNGTYSVRVLAGAQTDAAAGREVGQFTVAVPLRRSAAARPGTGGLRRLHVPAVRQDVLRTDSVSGASAAAVGLLAAR
jgi:hypothetical protein